MVVSRHEPVFQIYRETEEFQLCIDKYVRVRWMSFLEKFTGCHERVSHAFIQSYDGEIVHIGNLQPTINEATLRESKGLTIKGAKYFKGVGINKEMCQIFQKEYHQHPYWKKGFIETISRKNILQCLLVFNDFSLVRVGMLSLSYIILVFYFTLKEALKLTFHIFYG